MRVLLDALTAPGDPRGVGRYVRELAGALRAQDDMDVYVSIGRWHGSFYARLADAGVELVEVGAPGSGRLSRHGWHALGLDRLARRVQADIIHLHGPVPIPLFRSRPLIATIHDVIEVDAPQAFGPVQRRYRQLLVLAQSRAASIVLTPTQASAARIVAVHPRLAGRIRVTPFGPGSGPDVAPRPPETPLPDRFLLCVGTVQAHKNFERVVAAHRVLVDEGINIGLVIAGADGNASRAVDAAVAASRGSTPPARPIDVLRLRGTSDESIAWLYDHAVALVMPSLSEGFGLPIVEALARGCPVITSDRGATLEVTGGAARLVDPEAVDSIATGMREVSCDPVLRAKLAAAGRTRAAAFRWSLTAAATRRAYEDAVAS